MKHSALQLLRYLAPEISCSANQNFKPEKGYEGGTEQYSVQATLTKLENTQGSTERSWSIEMTIVQKVQDGQNFPYSFRLTIIGFFSCKDGFADPEDEERLVKTNGSTMLYGASRELIRTLTAIGPWNEIILPTLSFYEKDEKPASKEEPATD